MSEQKAKIVGCCKKTTVWIFVYENEDIFSICKQHFYSFAHRCDVKDVIHFKTRRWYNPDKIFLQYPIPIEDM